MIVLGVVLLILGLVAGVGLLFDLGLILIVIGVVLAILGATGRPVRGRSNWW